MKKGKIHKYKKEKYIIYIFELVLQCFSYRSNLLLHFFNNAHANLEIRRVLLMKSRSVLWHKSSVSIFVRQSGDVIVIITFHIKETDVGKQFAVIDIHALFLR